MTLWPWLGNEYPTSGVLRLRPLPTVLSPEGDRWTLPLFPRARLALIPSTVRIAAIHQRPSPLALARHRRLALDQHYRLSHSHASSTPSFAAPFALSPFRLLCPSRPNLASPLPSRPQPLSPRPADLSLSAFQPPTASAIHELLKAHLPGYRHSLPYLSSLRRLLFFWSAVTNASL